jgi:predicted transcriptional regulator
VSLGFARRVLTPARLQMLRWIRKLKPSSIYGLAKGLHRRKEAVLEDLRYLRQAGLVELIPTVWKGRRRLAPRVRSARLALTIEL